MYSYMAIKAEMQAEADDGVGERARSAEVARQSIEQAAWGAHQQRTG